MYHHHHQMYLQQQQQQQQQQRHLHYMRASSGMRPSPSSSRLVPETITVSDDDEEPPMSLVKRPPSPEKPKAVKSSSKEAAAGSSSLDCSSSKGRHSPIPFVPYREPESQNDVFITSASTSAFMPTFFSPKTNIKKEPETPKSESELPIVPKIEVEPSKFIKEEPKEEFSVEVGRDEAATAATTRADENDATNVKKEVDDDVVMPSLNMEECADLLLSLAGSFERHDVTTHDQPLQVQPDLEVDAEQTNLDVDVDIEDNFDQQHLSGLDLLLEGIQIHSKWDVTTVNETTTLFTFDGLDTLYAATKSDAWALGLSDVIDMSVLCAATEQDYFNILNWVDPMIELKNRYNLHSYKYENSRSLCRQFVTAKMKKFKKLNEMTGEKCLPPPDFESLDEVVKKIKNTEIMSQLEVELRSKLAQLQDLFRDKQRLMSRLKTSPKKLGSNLKSRSRGPGRPKKRCLKISAKTKMGRPRKRRQSEEANLESGDESDNNDDDDEANLSPPVLQPWSTLSRSPSPPPLFQHSKAAKSLPAAVSSSGGLLKPPKLTASFSATSSTAEKKFGGSANSVTNLSMLNAKFMKGKANPFQNLMKLASTPATKETSPKPENDGNSSSTDDDDEVEAKPESNKASNDSSVSQRDSVESGCERKYSDPEDGSASKRRKSEKPKRHFGSTETIVHKQPKNLFMMNCMSMQRGFSDKPETAAATAATGASSAGSSKADEYDFRDNDDDDDFDEADDADVDDRWSSKSKLFSQFRDQGRSSATPPLPSAATKSKPVWSPSSVTKAPSQPSSIPATSESPVSSRIWLFLAGTT